MAFLNERLGTCIKPTAFRGDIYISDEERRDRSLVHQILGEDRPFWIITSGGKYDFTNKWWDPTRYQEVVDHFKGKILFVQVGKLDHHHPPLEGVLNLLGKTSLRELVRLVYHSQGVLCPVTLLMHLAAAVPTKPANPEARPAVVIAGGRESVQWEAYNHCLLSMLVSNLRNVPFDTNESEALSGQPVAYDERLNDIFIDEPIRNRHQVQKLRDDAATIRFL